jgi:hypothetical protein
VKSKKKERGKKEEKVKIRSRKNILRKRREFNLQLSGIQQPVSEHSIRVRIENRHLVATLDRHWVSHREAHCAKNRKRKE